MNKVLSSVLLSIVFLLGCGNAAALVIQGGSLDQTNVGLQDIFVSWQTGPFTGGSGNPTGEETWVNSILNPDTVFTVKTESVPMYETDGVGIRAFELAASPAYFLVKNSKFRALFENKSDSDWGVVDVDYLASLGRFNLSGGDQLVISHVTEFGKFSDPDPDPDPDPMPVPGTVLLLGLGLLMMRRAIKA